MFDIFTNVVACQTSEEIFFKNIQILANYFVFSPFHHAIIDGCQIYAVVINKHCFRSQILILILVCRPISGFPEK